MKKSFLALAACAALCACTDDDIASLASGTADGEGASGSVVFLTVNIKDASSSTRAADGGFEYGTEDEQRIANAHFYFYNADGSFSAQGEATSVSGEGSETTPATNVEFKSNTVVAVWGIEDTSAPKYMVTVLNQPKDFTYGRTLEDMGAALAGGNCGWQDESGNFVMSTSSYVSYDDLKEETVRPAYYVTEITESNFRSEPVNLATDYEDEEDDIVQVYVERLAAKVEVDVDFSKIPDVVEDNNYGYLIPASYLGVNIITKVDVMTGDPLEDEEYDGSKYYVAINGWNLTGTARNSNVVKDITGFDVNNGIDGWTGWNDPGNQRSYWGKSWNYGLTDGTADTLAYPLSAVTDTVSLWKYSLMAEYDNEGLYHNLNGNTFRGNYDDVEDSDVDTLWLNKYLKYSSLKDPIAFGGYTYCSENTNSTDVLEKRTSSGLTNVILKGQFGIYDGGTLTPVDLILYKGEYYTVDAFKDHIAARVIAYDFQRLLTEQLGSFSSYLDDLRQTVYVKDKSITDNQTDANYIPFDGRFVRLMDWGDGKVRVRMQQPTAEGFNSTSSEATKFYPSDKYWHVYDMEVDCVSEAKDDLGNYDIYLIYDASGLFSSVVAAAAAAVLNILGIECTTSSNTVYAKFGGDSYAGSKDLHQSGTATYYTWRNYMLWEIEREAWTLNWYLKDNEIVPQLYAGGLMYYNAPIEHLNTPDVEGSFIEGQYGIVRNHLYKVTIDDVAKLGTPIANEESVIVPQDKDLQYLGASVNVLSWKVVEQSLGFTK